MTAQERAIRTMQDICTLYGVAIGADISEGIEKIQAAIEAAEREAYNKAIADAKKILAEWKSVGAYDLMVEVVTKQLDALTK